MTVTQVKEEYGADADTLCCIYADAVMRMIGTVQVIASLSNG